MQNALDQLAKAPPTHLDRSVFPGTAWSVQSQILTGLRFLGLIDEDGKTSPALVRLAEDIENRKKNWETLLNARYDFVLHKVDLSTATPKQVNDAMASYGATGVDTQAKAVRFFLSAAHFAGLKLSPYLLKDRKPVSGRRRRPVTKKSSAENGPPLRPPEQSTGASAQGLSIDLKSGGSLTLTAKVDLFSISTEDRNFVLKMIDALRQYPESAKEA